MQPDEMIARYRSRSLRSFGEILLSVADAMDLVNDCDNADLAILGLETFTVTNGDIVPRLDLIADYAPRKRYSGWDQYREDVNDDARSFLIKLTEDSQLAIAPQVWGEDDWKAQRGPWP